MIAPESGRVSTVVRGAEVVDSTIVVVDPTVVETGEGDVDDNVDGERREVVGGAAASDEQATNATTPDMSHGAALTRSAYRQQ